MKPKRSTREFKQDGTKFVNQRGTHQEIREDLSESIDDDEITSMEEGFVRGYKRERDAGFEA